MEPGTKSPFETLIAEMEQTINRMKHISAQYHPIPISLENSALRKGLYDQFEQERIRLFMRVNCISGTILSCEIIIYW